MKEENRKDVNHKVILNERPAGFQNLPRKVVSQRQQQRQTWKIPVQERDDRPLLNNGDGFTLIELLVVVLIIGILAAVALPQYKLAVAKARMTQLVTLSNAVVQAQERYYLANGEYTNDWENLDIGVERPTEVRFTLHLNKLNSGQPNSVYAMDSRLPGILLIFAYTYAQRKNWDNVRKCYASNENSQANLLCKNATRNSTNGTADSYNTYIFN